MPELDFSELFSDSGLDPCRYQYFNQLLHHRTIVCNTDITEDIVEIVLLPLLEFENDDSNAKVTLILNTSGGSVVDGMMLCNVINSYKKPLDIIVPSYACSMGTIILCAGNKNPNVTKKCYPFSFALIHSGSTYVGGESTSVEDVINFNKEMDNRIKDFILTNTNITEELYNKHHRQQWYLTSQEMKEYGLVDEIIGAEE